jgi:hypothetical protein
VIERCKAAAELAEILNRRDIPNAMVEIVVGATVVASINNKKVVLVVADVEAQ